MQQCIPWCPINALKWLKCISLPSCSSAPVQRCWQQGECLGPALRQLAAGQAVLHAHVVVQLLQLGWQGNGKLSQVQGESFKGVFQLGKGRPTSSNEGA